MQKVDKLGQKMQYSLKCHKSMKSGHVRHAKKYE